MAAAPKTVDNHVEHIYKKIARGHAICAAYTLDALTDLATEPDLWAA